MLVCFFRGKQDFFYICPGHLKDTGFCKPDAEEAATVKAQKDKEDLEREKARVIAEFEERKKAREKRKAERRKDKDKDKNDKIEEKKDQDEETKDSEEKEKKVQEL